MLQEIILYKKKEPLLYGLCTAHNKLFYKFKTIVNKQDFAYPGIYM